MSQHPSQPDDPSQQPPKEWDVSDAADFDPEAFMESTGRLEQELAEEKNRNLRLMADYQNFQRRAVQNERVAKAQGVSSVVSSVVTVIDHFDLALAQDTSRATAQQIVDGVKVIRDELVKALTRHGVVVIEPQPNELFVPGKHEAIMQMAMEGVDPGHVSRTFQPGFTIREGDNEFVIRPAKVAVAP